MTLIRRCRQAPTYGRRLPAQYAGCTPQEQEGALIASLCTPREQGTAVIASLCTPQEQGAAVIASLCTTSQPGKRHLAKPPFFPQVDG